MEHVLARLADAQRAEAERGPLDEGEHGRPNARPLDDRWTFWALAPSKYETWSALVASPVPVGANVTTIAQVALLPGSEAPQEPPVPG